MSTQFAPMPAHAHSRPTPTLKTENFDMESLFDFNQGGPSPTTASSSRNAATPKHDWSPYEPLEDHTQQFSGPSHDYNQHRQQVGLPVGSMANMPPNGMFDGYNSMGDMGFNSGLDYNTGLDMEGDMAMDFSQAPAMFYPATSSRHPSQADTFINPNSIGGHEEAPSNVGRLWPGMHSQQAQQAALQKVQQEQQMNQQRQMKMQAYHQQRRQSPAGPSSQQPQQQSHSGNSQGKRASHAVEPHVEESISRLLNQMRQGSALSNGSDDAGSPGSVLPHIARLRKDEEEMDEDERLLASEEGKKLSSKERRQLRNKVSARAFRSRRKEYIGQLEGEVAMKAQEAQDLRNQNTALVNENERYRNLIETLLRHPSFTPFIEDISKNPAALSAVPPPPANGMQMQQPSTQPTPTPTHQIPQQQQGQQHPSDDIKSEYSMQFEAPQQQQQQQSRSQPQSQQQLNQQVGLAMIPENEHFAKVDINNFNRAMNFNQFNQSVNAF